MCGGLIHGKIAATGYDARAYVVRAATHREGAFQGGARTCISPVTKLLQFLYRPGENFARVDGREILNILAALPAGVDPPHWPHDPGFYAVFGMDEDDRCINTVDGIGVALTAIQGLNQQLFCLQKQNEISRHELETLKGHSKPPSKI